MASSFRVFLIRRSFSILPVVLGALTLTFIISRVVPANPAYLLVGQGATSEQIASVMKQLGLDRPLYEQYVLYLGQLFSGIWGNSINYNREVLTLILSNIPNSLTLIVIAQTFAFLLAVPLGVTAAVKRGTWVEGVLRVFSIVATAIPAFWLGMVLQLFFGSGLGVLPIQGYVDPRLLQLNPIPSVTGSILIDSALAGNVTIFRDVLWHLILPAFTLSLFPLGLLARQVRSAMLGVLNENYIRTAKAYGLPDWYIFYRLALKNAIIPAVILLGLMFAGAFIGVFFVETVFGLPGIGTLATSSIGNLDYPVIVGVVIFVSIAFVVVNFVVDVVQTQLDRRTLGR